jgi:ureidoglycolate hydrolase
MVHTCRGTISLHGAIIHTEDSCTFVISNGSTQTFHIKAANEVERQRWVTTLDLAKAKAIRAMESGENFCCCYFCFVIYILNEQCRTPCQSFTPFCTT